MASSPSSLPFEGEAKNHLYQMLEKPGPRGAYEARQVNGGLYVRVDMPGVVTESVTVAKRGEARIVTFTGKAPRRWECDTSDIRVYGGYIVLDRDPREIDIEVTLVNGSLRLFFPGADGVLHSLKSRTVNNKPQEEEIPAAAPLFNGEIPVFPTQESYHINPFLLSGVKGVFEMNEHVEVEGEDLTYLRVDLPGIGDETYRMAVVSGNRLMHGGVGVKDHRFDQGGRSYLGGVELMCKCCKMEVRYSLMKDGVFSVLFRGKSARNRLNNTGIPCFLGLLKID